MHVSLFLLVQAAASILPFGEKDNLKQPNLCNIIYKFSSNIIVVT